VSPHITLSRVKKGKADLKENEFPYPFETRPIHVDRIGLWESRLGEGSPVYISHKDFPLE
ncbi:MAG: 2'-5' RNA ligase family protein, partial [Balneolales bacterium]